MGREKDVSQKEKNDDRKTLEIKIKSKKVLGKEIGKEESGINGGEKREEDPARQAEGWKEELPGGKERGA